MGYVMIVFVSLHNVQYYMRENVCDTIPLFECRVKRETHHQQNEDESFFTQFIFSLVEINILFFVQIEVQIHYKSPSAYW